MFRKMRRIGQQLSDAECEDILRRAKSGVMAVYGDDGYPYAVPVNHVYDNGKIAFHCAREGHKLDAVRRNDKVSFCVIDRDDVIAKERTTAYISAVAFGRARIVDDETEMRRIAERIGEKYAPDYIEDCRAETDEVLAAGRMYCIEITVEHMTAKCGREVLRERAEAKKSD